MKWNLPPEPIPAYLDPALEVTEANDAPKLPPGVFIQKCVEMLLVLGLGIQLALWVTANCVVETGWGQKYRGWNLGGWKIREWWVQRFVAKYGRPPRWSRAPGNMAPGATPHDIQGGDPPWCYYIAFDSMAAYLTEWLKAKVPRPLVPTSVPFEIKEDGDYREAGRLFWAGDPEWFRALCLAGYKGDNTKARPDASVAAFLKLSEAMGLWWAQARLGVNVDGQWGHGSTMACLAFQKANRLPETGIADATTLAALARKPLSTDKMVAVTRP